MMIKKEQQNDIDIFSNYLDRKIMLVDLLKSYKEVLKTINIQRDNIKYDAQAKVYFSFL